MAYAPFRDSRTLGGFIMIDRATNATAGAGMIDYALARAANLHWQSTTVDKAARAAQKGQRPAVIWFTGLSGAGKTTLANLVEARLNSLGLHSTLLDGDNLRHGLNQDLGFTEADRVENIRRVAHVAALMVDAGLIALVSLISPYRADRADGARAGRTRRVPGGVRGHAPRRVPPPRREGLVCQGRRRADPQLHRRQRPLRAARRP